jgi:hypothetical protein
VGRALIKAQVHSGKSVIWKLPFIIATSALPTPTPMLGEAGSCTHSGALRPAARSSSRSPIQQKDNIPANGSCAHPALRQCDNDDTITPKVARARLTLAGNIPYRPPQVFRLFQ